MPYEILMFANFNFQIQTRKTKVIVGGGIREEERFFLNWTEYIQELEKVGVDFASRPQGLIDRYDGQRTDPGSFSDLLRFQESFRDILDDICLTRTIPENLWTEVFRGSEEMNEVVKPVQEVLRPVGIEELSGLTFKREVRAEVYRFYIYAGLKNLIVGKQIFRLRRCPECRLFFFDVTKNGRKKYCNPKTCGNRAKQRAFARRRNENN